jgi:hypothetical protein
MNWVLVPREPTEEMLKAGASQMADIVGDPYANDHWRHFANETLRIYRPMIAAANVDGVINARMVWCVICIDDKGECVHIFSSEKKRDEYLASDCGRDHICYDYVIDCPERMEGVPS